MIIIAAGAELTSTTRFASIVVAGLARPYFEQRTRWVVVASYSASFPLVVAIALEVHTTLVAVASSASFLLVAEI